MLTDIFSIGWSHKLHQKAIWNKELHIPIVLGKDDIFVLDTTKHNCFGGHDILLIEYFSALAGMYKSYQSWDGLPIICFFRIYEPPTVDSQNMVNNKCAGV